MSTYKAIGREIRSTIASVVRRTSGLSVIIGEKFPLESFPIALVIPGPDDITPDSNDSDQHMMMYLVVVVDETEDASEGLESTIDLAADIYDALTVDHTLNGVCDEVFLQRFDPRYLVGTTYYRHWVLIQMACRKQIGR